MKSRNRIAILFCLAIAIQAALAAQLPKSPVTILVTDTWGAVIPGAQVKLSPAPDPMPSSMQTGAVGELALNLKPGRYALEVTSRGFKKFVSPLEVPGNVNKSEAAASQPRPVTVILKLDIIVDRAVSDLKYVNALWVLLHGNLVAETLLPDEFKGLPHQTITYHNPCTYTDEAYSGVPLVDLLARYGVSQEKDPHEKALGRRIVATGYGLDKIEFSLAEIDAPSRPAEVLVADSMDGQPLDATNGPFKLVVFGEDACPGREIQNLFSIEVQSDGPITAATATNPAKLPVVIRVTDVTGARIVRAQIKLDPSPDPMPASAETDEKGELSLDLKPGRYHLEVTFNGFKKYTRPLEVQSDKNEAAAAGSKSHLVTVVMEVGRTDTPMIEVREGVLQLMLQPYYKGTLSLSQTDFRALAHKSVTYHNEHTKSDETYLGVALSDLLANYGVPLGKDLRGKALALYVVAAGSDNYKAVLSLAEIDPAFHPGDVIVADTMNGMPLDAASGPFKLVVTEDKRPARCVHNLVSLELRSAD